MRFTVSIALLVVIAGAAHAATYGRFGTTFKACGPELCAPAREPMVIPSANPVVLPAKHPVFVPAANPIVVKAAKPQIFRQPPPEVYLQKPPAVYEQPAPAVYMAPAKGVECATFAEPLKAPILAECASEVEQGKVGEFDNPLLYGAEWAKTQDINVRPILPMSEQQ